LPKGPKQRRQLELAHDIAIYDIIVESLVWSRIGKHSLFALPISLQAA
jgi:hypothetical protein